MQPSNLFIIQCIVIGVLLVALYYSFSKRFQYHQLVMESLQNQILVQQNQLDKQERILRQMVGVEEIHQPSPPLRPVRFESQGQCHSPRTTTTIPLLHKNSSSSTSSSTVQPTPPMMSSSQPPAITPGAMMMNLAPMVGSLLGASGLLAPLIDPQPVMEISSSSTTVGENPKEKELELELELKKELEELHQSEIKGPEIQEGRIETMEAMETLAT